MPPLSAWLPHTRGDRPLEKRVETHIFICVLAYHLLVAIEKMFRVRNVHVSWETAPKDVRTHQVVTTTFPTKRGRLLKIRKATKPEPVHTAIHKLLQIPEKVMSPRRTWIKPGVESQDFASLERAKLFAGHGA
jgi:hypothetical protein